MAAPAWRNKAERSSGRPSASSRSKPTEGAAENLVAATSAAAACSTPSTYRRQEVTRTIPEESPRRFEQRSESAAIVEGYSSSGVPRNEIPDFRSLHAGLRLRPIDRGARSALCTAQVYALGSARYASFRQRVRLTLHDGSILVPPPDFANPAEPLTAAVRRPVGKFDPAERDAHCVAFAFGGQRCQS
ncbi:hypothetical protein ACVWZ6_001645 [Bradyrhizobium sp. GM6.1]